MCASKIDLDTECISVALRYCAAYGRMFSA